MSYKILVYFMGFNAKVRFLYFVKTACKKKKKNAVFLIILQDLKMRIKLPSLIILAVT